MDRYASCGYSSGHLHASWARYMSWTGIRTSLTGQGVLLLEYHGAVPSGVTLEVHSQGPRFIIYIGGDCHTPRILRK
jgi:hypothetical protein